MKIWRKNKAEYFSKIAKHFRPQNQSKYQILFHKDSSPRDLHTMTLKESNLILAVWACTRLWCIQMRLKVSLKNLQVLSYTIANRYVGEFFAFWWISLTKITLISMHNPASDYGNFGNSVEYSKINNEVLYISYGHVVRDFESEAKTR